MKTTEFFHYLHAINCDLVHRGRLYWVMRGPAGGIAQIQRKQEYLERATIYLHCMDLGVDMPEKFADFQRRMDIIWPGRRFGS